MRYFVNGQQIAICESDRTAQRYAESPDWEEVSEDRARLVWHDRDIVTLYRMRCAAIVAKFKAQAEQATAQARAVGGH